MTDYPFFMGNNVFNLILIIQSHSQNPPPVKRRWIAVESVWTSFKRVHVISSPRVDPQSNGEFSVNRYGLL